MPNDPATVRYVQERLPPPRFTLKAMFGEHALYADGKVVALVCDDRVYVKVHDATAELEGAELAPPYPGAKPHYVAEEGQLADPGFAGMLLTLARHLPAPKGKATKAGTSSDGKGQRATSSKAKRAAPKASVRKR